MRFSRFLVVFALAAAPGFALVANPLGIELRFDRLNGLYENVVAEVEPIRSGPVTVRLVSPEHRLELKSNQIALSPFGDDSHVIKTQIRFSGSGLLNAELDFGGIPASLRDRVVFPEQEALVEGKVRIERVDEGYLVTVEELPGSVAIEIRSELGSELVAWCSRLALFVAGDAGCDDLESALSPPRLPLPARGTTHLIRADELTPEERSRIDVYLSRF